MGGLRVQTLLHVMSRHPNNVTCGVCTGDKKTWEGAFESGKASFYTVPDLSKVNEDFV